MVEVGQDRLQQHTLWLGFEKLPYTKNVNVLLCGLSGNCDLPWKTRQDVACEKHVDVDREKSNKDKTYNGDKRAYHGFAVADSLGYDTVQHEPDDLCGGSSIADSCLPGRSDLIRLNTVLDACWFAIFPGKGGHAVEVTEEPGVVAFHDDGQREGEGEEDGFWVKPTAFTETHFPLTLGSRFCVFGELDQVWDGD